MANELEFMIAGISHRMGEYEKAQVAIGDSLSLEPEPTNPHDPNAVRILKNGIQLGYVPRGLCTKILLAISSKVELSTVVTNAWSRGCSVRVTGELTQ